MIKTFLTFVLSTALVLVVLLGLTHLGLGAGFTGLNSVVVTVLGLALTFIVRRYRK